MNEDEQDWTERRGKKRQQQKLFDRKVLWKTRKCVGINVMTFELWW